MPKSTKDENCYFCDSTIAENARTATPGRYGKIRLDTIPEKWQEVLVEIGFYTTKDVEEGKISACQPCHTACTQYFTDEQRARYLTSPLALKNALRSVGWFE